MSETQETEQGLSEEQAAEKLLSRMRKEPEPEHEEEEPANETEPESEALEDAPEDDEVEADFLGEKVKVRGKEASELVQRFAAKAKELEANTTRKFQEAAEVRKSAEKAAEAAQLVQALAEKHGEMLGHRTMVQQRMQQLRNIDVRQLQAQDPAALAGLTAEMQQLQMTEQEITRRLAMTAHGIQEQRAQLQAQGIEEAKKYAQTIKGWSEEYDAKLLDYVVKDVGAPADEVRAKMSGWLMKLIHQAYEGQKVSQSKPWEKKSPGSNQTLKPGTSGQSKGQTTAAVESAQKRFKKSGSLDDAAQLLLARSKLRKR